VFGHGPPRRRRGRTYFQQRRGDYIAGRIGAKPVEQHQLLGYTFVADLELRRHGAVDGQRAFDLDRRRPDRRPRPGESGRSEASKNRCDNPGGSLTVCTLAESARITESRRPGPEIAGLQRALHPG
jgi:hypothetical protein